MTRQLQHRDISDPIGCIVCEHPDRLDVAVFRASSVES